MRIPNLIIGAGHARRTFWVLDIGTAGVRKTGRSACWGGAGTEAGHPERASRGNHAKPRTPQNHAKPRTPQNHAKPRTMQNHEPRRAMGLCIPAARRAMGLCSIPAVPWASASLAPRPVFLTTGRLPSKRTPAWPGGQVEFTQFA